MKKKVYVVVTDTWRNGDVYGLSATAEKVWYQHVSSNISFLVRDTTSNFGRSKVFAEAFPEGIEVVLVDVGDTIPEEIAHHFKVAAEQSL